MTPFGIDVIVIEPGPVRAEWNRIAQEMLIAISDDGVYGAFARRHAKALGAADSFGSSPEAVAETIARSIRARRPRSHYAVGGMARLMLLARRLLSDRMFDRLTWRLSQRTDAASLLFSWPPAASPSRLRTGRRLPQQQRGGPWHTERPDRRDVSTVAIEPTT